MSEDIERGSWLADDIKEGYILNIAGKRTQTSERNSNRPHVASLTSCMEGKLTKLIKLTKHSS